MRDDVDGGRELHVAAHVIAVRVGVDDHRDRFARQPLDLVENRLAPSGILRVDDHDAVGADEHGGVASPAFEQEQVVLELLDLDNLRRRRLLIGRDGERE